MRTLVRGDAADHVRVELADKLVLVKVLNGAQQEVARVVHQRVDPAVPPKRHRNDSVDRGPVPDIKTVDLEVVAH